MSEPLQAARLSEDGRVKDVRADHVSRYQWAAERLYGHVVDAGCNCGYGAAILADAGLRVTAVDIWPDGLDFAREHWGRPGIEWRHGDVTEALPGSDAVTAFEVIEHLARPETFLRLARESTKRLLASVPNQDVWPWEPRLAPAHHRHYRRTELADMLNAHDWRPVKWWGQHGPHSPVEPGVHGRTIVVECI